ncbi:MAG: dockerin type I repeat-containing protein [Ruminococcus sp.]|nr:dockerin type I repeat-containing protein [Ruminococcus sp.]
MKLKKMLSAALAAAVMLTVPLSLPDSSKLFMMSASAEGTKDVTDYTYTVTPLVSPLNYYFYIKTDNPDPESFRFIDKSSKYKEKNSYNCVISHFSIGPLEDVDYENTETLRVNGGYIFDCTSGNVDGGELVLQRGLDYDAISGWCSDWEDTDVTVTVPELVDKFDYIINKYAKGKTFFDKLSALQTGLDKESLYSGAYVRGELYRCSDYWRAEVAHYVDQGLCIVSPYDRKDDRDLLATYLFPYFLTSIGFPSFIATAAKRMDSSITYKWNEDSHYLIDVTYKGKTKSFGGQGGGEGQGITKDKIAHRYTFKNSEATSLEQLRELQKTYRTANIEDDIPHDDELTWEQIYATVAPGAWVKGNSGTGYYYWYDVHNGDDFYFTEGGVGSNIYWSGDLKWAKDCWADGRYIDRYKKLSYGDTFEDHPTANILVRSMPFFELIYYYYYEENYDTGEFETIYTEAELTEKVKDVLFVYNEENDRWEADPSCYAKNMYYNDTDLGILGELADKGFIDKKYLDKVILTRDQVEAMHVDSKTNLAPRSGFIYDGTAAPGTPFCYANGDVNGDGAVDTTDLAWFARYLAGWTDYSFLCESADIDGDGNVTTTDYSLLARALAGWKGYAETYEIPA